MRGWAWLCVLLAVMVVAGDVGAQPDGGAGGAAPAESSDHSDGGAAPVGAVPVDELTEQEDQGSAPPPPPPDSLDCRSKGECRNDGLCTAEDGVCVASSDLDCVRSIACLDDGRCQAHEGICAYWKEGRLAPPPEAYECRDKLACGFHGRCTWLNNRCSARSWEDCFESLGCKRHGRCVALSGRCVFDWNVAQCRNALSCRQDGERCFYNANDDCDDGTERNSTGLMVGGIVLSGVGGMGLVAALFTGIFGGIAAAVNDIATGGDSMEDVGTAVAGLAIGGGVLGVAGIPLAVVGAHRSPREPRDILTPTVSIGSTGGSLTWRF